MLEDAGIESYCPLNLVSRTWSDRVKKVEEPLFKSYVFVNITSQQKQIVKQVTGVVNFVYWLGKPAIIRDSEIEEIKRFLGEHESVTAIPLAKNILPGQRLRITSGVMMNMEATVVKVHNKTVEVIIHSIGYKLVANIEKNKLEMA